jgi:hypothetical protein
MKLINNARDDLSERKHCVELMALKRSLPIITRRECTMSTLERELESAEWFARIQSHRQL